MRPATKKHNSFSVRGCKKVPPPPPRLPTNGIHQFEISIVSLSQRAFKFQMEEHIQKLYLISSHPVCYVLASFGSGYLESSNRYMGSAKIVTAFYLTWFTGYTCQTTAVLKIMRWKLSDALLSIIYLFIIYLSIFLNLQKPLSKWCQRY